MAHVHGDHLQPHQPHNVARTKKFVQSPLPAACVHMKPVIGNVNHNRDEAVPPGNRASGDIHMPCDGINVLLGQYLDDPFLHRARQRQARLRPGNSNFTVAVHGAVNSRDVALHVDAVLLPVASAPASASDIVLSTNRHIANGTAQLRRISVRNFQHDSGRCNAVVQLAADDLPGRGDVIHSFKELLNTGQHK